MPILSVFLGNIFFKEVLNAKRKISIILVFLEDGPPIFYFSKRVGKNMRIFTMPKIRTNSEAVHLPTPPCPPC